MNIFYCRWWWFRNRQREWERYVETDPQLLRPAEVDLLIGDASKARQKLGWEPRVKFEELVSMMVESDLDYVGSQTAKTR